MPESKLLHQMWYDKNIYDNEDPPSKHPKYKTYIQNWRQRNPNLEYCFWNRRRIEELWKDPRLSRWSDFFKFQIRRHIEKCDFTRYAILWCYGGLYADLDFDCLRSMESLINEHDLGLTSEPVEHLKDTPDKDLVPVTNGLMFSMPNHPVWPGLMDYIQDNYKPNNNVLENTGPAALARYLHSHPEYPLLDYCLMNPLTKQGTVSQQCPVDTLKRAYAVTYWKEGTGWGKELLWEKLPYFGFYILIGIVIIIGICLYLRSRKYSV